MLRALLPLLFLCALCSPVSARSSFGVGWSVSDLQDQESIAWIVQTDLPHIWESPLAPVRVLPSTLIIHNWAMSLFGLCATFELGEAPMRWGLSLGGAGVDRKSEDWDLGSDLVFFFSGRIMIEDWLILGFSHHSHAGLAGRKHPNPGINVFFLALSIE